MRMDRNPFYIFVDFVTCNNTINRIHSDMEHISERLRELDVRRSQAEKKRDTAYNELHRLYKEQHRLEMESEDAAKQLRTKRQQLEQTVQPKEYISLEKEVARLQEVAQEADEAVMRIWDEVNAATQTYHDAQCMYQETFSAVDTEYEQLQAQKHAYHCELQEEQRKYEELRSQVRQEWLETFERKRKQVADPAVAVEHNVCSACFSTLPNNALRKLERHVILTCPNCHRMLYMV